MTHVDENRTKSQEPRELFVHSNLAVADPTSTFWFSVVVFTEVCDFVEIFCSQPDKTNTAPSR
ncbi:hypothetical protein C7C56_008850 [Massilia glaciei]|uniref:Uncharacterized protein n=1 Tax=Massilia glaciei TaxID=1524097 RepID=A0A2U2HNH3_9BURK|nr:hypothetical protein C7C56_008850 [Massilia glaciei]